MTAVVAGLAVALIGLTSVALAYAGRAQASAAADAAALAAAVATYPDASIVSPYRSAGQVAEANGARLLRCVCAIDPTLASRTVTVLVGVPIRIPILGELLVRAAARAEFDPAAWLGR